LALSGETLNPSLKLPVSSGVGVTFEASLSKEVVAILRDEAAGFGTHRTLPDGMKVYTYREVVAAGVEPAGALHRLCESQHQDALVLALALTALFGVDQAGARAKGLEVGT